MIPTAITAVHVLQAIAEIDKTGVPSSRQSALWDVVFQGRLYPPKYVVSLAAKYATGQVLPSQDFNGGSETNGFLQNLGFDIKSKSASTTLQTTRSHNAPRQSGTVHSERCQACKKTVRALLEKLYGTVEVEKRFPIGATQADFAASPFLPELNQILARLVQARGFTDFIRTDALPTCDYFLPRPGFVLELDESQHFTPLRKVALSSYPASLPLGFDRKRWIAICEEINARDDEPPHRDEQRAWYDTLRDFLPSVLGLLPTVRLAVSEYPWCELKPNSREDLEKFRQILSERAQFWSIDVHGSPGARYGRVAIDGAWSGDLNAARRLLGDVAAGMAPHDRLTCLCTCGAFLRFDWPADLPYRGNLDPKPQRGLRPQPSTKSHTINPKSETLNPNVRNADTERR